MYGFLGGGLLKQSISCTVGQRTDGTVLGPLGGGLMGQSTSCTVGWRTDGTVLVLLDVGLMGQYLDTGWQTTGTEH